MVVASISDPTITPFRPHALIHVHAALAANTEKRPPMATRERPLSPHLQIYTWQVQMQSSIYHRATGILLSVGALVITCGLVSLAAGPERWESFTKFAGSIPGLVVLCGFNWALSYHLINGIRHLLQDGGLGFRIPQFVRNSLISMIGSVVLTAAVWGVILARWGH